jgi:hypothetical protein
VHAIAHEFALAWPVFALLALAAIQIGLLCYCYFSQSRMTRETARWLAINATDGVNASDAQVAAHVQANVLPGLVGGPPHLVSAGDGQTHEAVYTVGKLTASFTACLPSGSPAVCNALYRQPGHVVSVQLTYDVSDLIFLPLPLPHQLPPARISLPAF